MTSPVIDTVLYDFGNVLVHWDPYGPYEGRMSREDVDTFFAEVGFATLNHERDAGATWASARAAVTATHPHHVAALDLYVDNFAASLTGPVEGSEDLVRELRNLGVRLYGLTNWSDELFHHAGPAAPATTLLDDVLVSGRVGLAKPDPRIFTTAVERFDLTPRTTLFVDDLPHNIEAASALGFRTHRFTDTPGLRAALRDLGVDIG